ncbi:MAG: hypothetical protein N3D11_04675 [Candidatus Sumerlaeia bacterium]|nr:hypothetical protein [Candidatus Sumerlaeia bacterium]
MRKATENLFWLAYESTTRFRVRDRLAQLEHDQYLPPDELQHRQQTRLRALLEHAAAHVPYYRDLFRKLGLSPADIRSPSDLMALPPLERDTLRTQPEQLVADGLSPAKLRTTRTSGTTGMPITVYHDPEAFAEGVARYWRALRACGYRIGDPMLRTVPREGKTWKNRLGDWFRAVFFRDRQYELQQGQPQMLRQLAELLQKWRPRFFRAYTGVLTLLAGYLRHRGIRLQVPRLIGGAQLMTDADRQLLQNFLAREVFDYYSSDETLGIAFECEAHTGLHLNSDCHVVEAVVAGRPAQPGELGEVFVTVLTNYAMPLIRYRLWDTLTPAAEVCPCGRSLPLIQMTHGRVLDLIRVPNGGFITPGFFFRLIYSLGEHKITQFQVIQETLEQLRLRLVRGPDYSASDETGLRDGIAQASQNQLAVEFEYVDAIPLTARGKLRITQSQIPAAFD